MEWKELNTILDRWIRWHRLRRGVRWGLRGMAVGLAIALAAAIGLAPRHLLLGGEYASLAAGLGLLGLCLAACAGLAWRLDRLELARGFDLSFGLRERVSTALELGGETGPDGLSGDWQARQLSDALSAARKVDPGKARPLRLERLPLLLAAGMALGLGLLGYFGRPWFQAAQQQRQVAQAIQAEKNQIAGTIEEIQKAKELSPAQKEALTRPLAEALNRLQESQTPEQALTALGQAEEKLRAMTGQVSTEQLQALHSAGQQLAEGSAPSPLKQTGQALAQGDLAQAGQDLKNLDLNSLTAEQRKALIDQLNQAGQTLSQSGSPAGQDLQNAAQALQQGPAGNQAAQQSLNQAGQAIQAAGQQAAQNQAAGQAANQLQQGQAALAQAGQQPGDGQNAQANGNGQSPAGQAGQGQQPGAAGQGNQPGQGNGNGNGQDQQANNGQQGGGGAGRGEGTGQNGTAGQAGQGPIGQNNGTGDGGEKSSEQIYAPQRLGGQGGPTVDLPGSGQPGNQVTGQQPSTQGQPGQSQVPYVNVLPAYADAAHQAMQNGEAPAYLLPVIRQYFSSLQQ